MGIQQLNEQKLMTVREIRGRTIITRGIKPESLTENTYFVPSQTLDKKYIVRKTEYYWTCQCPDYKFRKVECKHVHAIKFWLMLRERMNA